MNRRLVITGMGAITPIGLGVEEYWHNLIQGKCGVGPITLFDTSKLPVRIGAEVKGFADHYELPKNIDRSAAPFMKFAFAAGREALLQSGLDQQGDRQRIGVCMGSAMAGVNELARSGIDYANSETGRISPHLIPRNIANMAIAHLAITYGLHGPGFALATACSAGGDAIMSAAMLILSGETDAVIAMGGESILCPSIVSSLAQAKALSRRNDEPKAASRPFDLNRDGFVIGEGGGALVIENEEHALKRGAKIYAVLSGWGNTLDAYHITAPDPEGSGAAACMRKALQKANLSASDIDYINAHGTSTQLGDRAETLAMKDVFGPKNTAPPVSSTKGATGHLMGAGGLTEVVACIMAINHNIMPPTLNLDDTDPLCDLDYVPNVAREANIKAAMSNSLGFGGQNSSIIVTRY